jgi:SAM-dependent methyltransferase
MAIPANIWLGGVNYELGFWRQYIHSKGAQWPEDFRNRIDPKRPLNPKVENAIRDTGSREIEILDVGSGPITSLGYVSNKFDIKITATDPLAEQYSTFLDEVGVTPPVRTQKCFGENLLDQFGSRRFDVCYSSNALDHSLDPRNILRAMALLLRPHGLLYVQVHKNEGEKARYTGLHNWNFDRDENNNFILWRGEEKYKINEDLSDIVESQVSESITSDGPEIFLVGYRKAA